MNPNRQRRSSPQRAAGFSLVELMVAVVIGLIGCVVIFQVFSVFEGQKRTATSSGDAQQNGLLALVSLERDGRMAGYGINYPPLLGCSVQGYDSNGPRNFTFTLTGVQITEGAAGAPDAVTFVYGSSGQLVAPAQVYPNANALGDTSTTLNNVYGFNVGDLVVFGQVVPTGNPQQTCNLRQVSAVSAGSSSITHDTTQPHNAPGGLVQAYTAWNPTSQINGRVYDLGPASPAAGSGDSSPVVGIYTVQNSQLTYQNLISDAAASPVADNIVQMQMQYGYDSNADGVVQSTEWINGCANPAQLPIGAAGACVAAASTDWAKVISIRMAVLARSAQPEIPSTGTGTACDTTKTAPTWAGGNIDPSVVDPTSWKCYRYQVFETQVPVRNLIWFPL